MEPDKVKVHKASYELVDPDVNTAKGGTTFDKLDNPGGLSSFYYRPIFLSRAQGCQRKDHCLPAGCHTVRPNEDDAAIPTHRGWIFLPRVEEGLRQGCGEGEHF